MNTFINAAIWFVAGMSLWTFAEYAIHNWIGHKFKGKVEFSKTHLKHHAKTNWYAPTRFKVMTGLKVLLLLAPLASLALGIVSGLAFAVGFIVMYVAYEVIHRRCHTHPPRGWYSRWARRHHFYHHFKAPNMNHGVSTPIWDIVFRTYVKPGVIKVPEKHVMDWLVDENGQVKAQYSQDYEIGRRNRRGKSQATDAKAQKADELVHVDGVPMPI